MKPLDVSEQASWKQRYRAASVRWSKLASQNSDRGVVCSNKDGVYQLYAWDVSAGILRQLTHQPAGVVNGTISADGSAIFYHKDDQGNEVGHFMRVPFEGGAETSLTADFEPYPSWGLAINKTGTAYSFITAPDDGFCLYWMGNESPDAPVLICRQSEAMYGPILSYDGRLIALDSAARTGSMDTAIVVLDSETGDQVGELWEGDGVNTSIHSFSPVQEDERLLAISSGSGYNRPLIWHPRTGKRADLVLDGLDGDVFAWGWSADGERILLCQIYQAKTQLYIYTVAQNKAERVDHQSGVYEAGYFTADGQIVANWQDGTRPSQVVKLNAQTGERIETLLEAGSAPASQPWRSVSFAGAKGVEIQAWLTVPTGDGPFPTILHTHGGPTAVMKDVFSPEAQAWVDHGFAYMSVNYHGSTTFGKGFEKSIWGNLGDLEIDDMTAACHWLIENKIALAGNVLLTGRSYGGYLTLQALGRTPELWAGGMAQVAIADWGLMYEDQIETLRSYQRALFGGEPHEVPEATRKSSPITYAGAVQAPILVVQGEHDARCPARQMRVYEETLMKLGKSIEIHWFNAGHGSYDQEEGIEHQELKMRFAYRILG